MNKRLLIFILIFASTKLYAFNLVGTWKLLSIERNIQNQWKPDCNSPTGLLIYTKNGYMAANINCMLPNSLQQPSFSEHDVTFYSGTYSIKGNDVIHHVNNSNSPIYFGKDLSRRIEIISQNSMNLIVKDKNGQIIRLSWIRIN